MTWTTFFLRRPVMALMINLALVCGGVFAYTRLQLNDMPEVNIPIVTISISLPGASPSLIQSTITKPVEDAVAVISGVDTISSVSSTGLSETTIKFDLSQTSNEAMQECRDKVDAITGDFPKDTDKPTFATFSSNDSPAAKLTISSSQRTLEELTELVKRQIKDEIQSVSGVAEVKIYGERERQIKIVLDTNQLKIHKTTVADVTNAIVAANQDVPGGSVTSPYEEYSLSLKGQFHSVREFGEVIVREDKTTVNDDQSAFFFEAPLKVSDLAIVKDEAAEQSSLARLNGNPTLTLSVKKSSNANLVKVVEGLQEKVSDLSATMPKDLSIVMVEDGAENVKYELGELQQHLVLGGFLACLMVVIFLRDLRLTFIAATAIPVSLVSTFTAMSAFGFTLNSMTLLALTLAVGLVIDDAIVVMENTHKMMEERGLDPMAAAEASLLEIGSAVLATTLSLAILFLPLSIMPGEIGLYFRSWGVTMAVTIMMSMVVSFTLTPVMCAKLLKKPTSKVEISWLDRVLQDSYIWILKLALRMRFVVILVAILVLLSSVKMAGMVGKEFLADEDDGEYNVTLTFPRGWPLSRIAEALVPVEQSLLELPHVVDVLTTVDKSDITKANIYMKLTSYDDRKPYTQFQSESDARVLLKKFPRLQPSVGSGTEKDFSYPILGDDPDVLSRLADEFKEKLQQTPGFLDVDTNMGEPSPEVEILLDRGRLAALDLKADEVGDALDTMVGGSKITTYHEDSLSYDVYARALESQRNSPEKVRFLPVGVTANKDVVTLDSVARLDSTFGPSSIHRMKRRFQVTVEANLDKSLPLQEANDKAKEIFKQLDAPAGYGTADSGNTKLLQETAVGALQALVLAIAFMYMVLASQYEDFLDPLIILSTIPLALPFGLLSLVVTGMTLNLFSILGMFLLFGVVKKNAILQIEQTNYLLHQGKPLQEAILEANRERLRPILMTTVILVFAMMPVALAGPTGAETSPMAVVVVGGQSLCLLLTLVVVPVATSLVEDGKARWKNFKERRRS